MMMKADIWRFLGVCCASVFTGLFFGQVFLFLAGGLVVFLIWQYSRLNQLLKWIQHRKNTEPPYVPGVIDEIAKEIDFLQMNHKKRKKKLSRFLKRFQESTAALPDAVIIMGENNEIEWANSNAEKYLGVRWPQDARQRISNLVRHPDLSVYLKSIENKQTERALHLASPINKDRKLELRIVPYGDTQQLLIARDITKIYLAEKVRKDFIANASHELRTPLTVISGYLEALEEEAAGSLKSWEGQLKNMRVQTNRMRRLIEDLLKLSSLETAQELSVTGVVRVPELLAAIYEEAMAVGGLIEHIYSIEADPGLWIKGNYNEIYSAFSNLVVNAVQHTPEKGVIKIHWFREGPDACLEVIDNGEGIEQRHISRLTERFYRVDKGRSREKGGTGLGLAIVKHVLARHKATLEIESETGKGSTFRCRFPESSVISLADGADVTLSA